MTVLRVTKSSSLARHLVFWQCIKISISIISLYFFFFFSKLRKRSINGLGYIYIYVYIDVINIIHGWISKEGWIIIVVYRETYNPKKE